MRPLLIAFILMVGLGMSCTDEDKSSLACEIDKPVENIAWLAQMTNEMNQSGSNDRWISRARQGSKTIFIFGNCCINCQSVYPVYSCEGLLLGFIGEHHLDVSLLDHDEIIWTSGCNF